MIVSSTHTVHTTDKYYALCSVALAEHSGATYWMQMKNVISQD